jgi:hypothetical protein
MAKWRDPRREKPPLHKSVIVLLKNGVGTTYDVACYAGLQPEGEDRWILADVRLDTKQIAYWQNPQRPPK